MNRREAIVQSVCAAFGAVFGAAFGAAFSCSLFCREPMSRWVTMDGGKTFRVSNSRHYRGIKMKSAASYGGVRMDLLDGEGNTVPLRDGEVYEAPYNSMRVIITS